ncbi:MAG: LpxL/LpxP family Kdo(2)-lipid IV(A) lauroyl/palmitoleoyl acyltransferase [Pseudomonadota bacterium]
MQPLWHPRFWPTWFGFGLLYLWQLLPWRWSMWLGARLGGLLRRVLKSRVKITRRNLELCFPELDPAARETMLRGSFASAGCMVPEAGLAWYGSAARIARLSTLSGTKHLDEALEAGQGVLLLAAHFTTLEIVGRIVCQHHRESKGVLYREHRNAALEYLVRRGRGGYSGASFNRQQTRGAVRHLRKGGLLWYAPDQDYERGQSVFAPFFGRQASTSVSAHQLAAMGRARVLTLRQRRHKNGYEVVLEPALEGVPSDDALADMTRINAEMERIIRECPEQYMWLHRRFKNRPPGEASVYD